MSAKPTAIDGLDVTEVKDGLVVFDPGRDRVHFLNATAAVVFTLCDGERHPPEIGAGMSAVFGPDAVPLTEVEACLAKLVEEGIVR